MGTEPKPHRNQHNPKAQTASPRSNPDTAQLQSEEENQSWYRSTLCTVHRHGMKCRHLAGCRMQKKAQKLDAGRGTLCRFFTLDHARRGPCKALGLGPRYCATPQNMLAVRQDCRYRSSSDMTNSN